MPCCSCYYSASIGNVVYSAVVADDVGMADQPHHHRIVSRNLTTMIFCQYLGTWNNLSFAFSKHGVPFVLDRNRASLVLLWIAAAHRTQHCRTCRQQSPEEPPVKERSKFPYSFSFS